jgi:hypothetical protein
MTEYGSKTEYGSQKETKETKEKHRKFQSRSLRIGSGKETKPLFLVEPVLR